MPGLTVTYDDLRRELGRFLGWGRDFTIWTEDQKIDSEDIIKSALRRVYWPTEIQMGMVDYQWSFLESTAVVNCKAGQQEILLPDDFGDIVGKIFFKNQIAYPPIEVTTPSVLLNYKSRFAVTGIPRVAAFTASHSGGATETKWVLMLYPVAQADYELWFRYNISPDYLLSPENQFIYGGRQFGELFIEAVLAVAEEKLMDMPGIHTQRFQLELASAVKRDSRNNRGENLGYASDPSVLLPTEGQKMPNFRPILPKTIYGG